VVPSAGHPGAGPGLRNPQIQNHGDDKSTVWHNYQGETLANCTTKIAVKKGKNNLADGDGYSAAG
jgi:hypothetical protein